MRARERFSCAVGNVFNDLYSQLVFSFLIIFLMKVVELSASQAGMMVLIAQISDASISLITGYLGDNVNVLFPIEQNRQTKILASRCNIFNGNRRPSLVQQVLFV